MESVSRQVKPLILLLGIILIFFPVLGYSQNSESYISISAEVQGQAVLPPPPPEQLPPGAPAIIPPFPPAKVIFEGRAYPDAFLTLLKNGMVAATFFAESSGLFAKEITGFPGGNYAFGIWAEDTEGRKSITLSFRATILGGVTTTISGIFIPPTIETSLTQVEIGKELNILGQVFPKSLVKIFISSEEIVKRTTADEDGKWTYKLNTSSLKEGRYEVKARAIHEDGEMSPLSQTLSFLVLTRACQGADLNLNGRVDIVDFSILLYFWGQSNPADSCSDTNFDGIVDIVDFSIMMYWWTG